jgi:hypothetical protein
VARKVALRQRDVELLSLLVERRAETLDYLHARFFGDWTLKPARNRLARLCKAGYLHRESVSLHGTDGRLESVYTLGPRAKAALVLRRAAAAEAFDGRRFNPTLRSASLDHQILTNRVGDWLGADLRHEHLLPAHGKGDAFRHRPDAVYTAAQADAQGRRTVFLEVDLGHYSRERILGKVKAFLANDDARTIVFASPTPGRAALVNSWVRDVYGDAIGRRMQTLTFDQLREGGYLHPGAEPPTAVDDAAA